MNRPKPRVVAIKVEQELAELLDRLPNKSAFIRQAILAKMSTTCPLCHGAGRVPAGIHRHFAPVILSYQVCVCLACGERHPIPNQAVTFPMSEQPWWEQFLSGGPFYCPACYELASACEQCGWHLAPGQIAEHLASHGADPSC